MRQEARKALRSRKGLHTLSVVYDTLWDEAEAHSGRANGEIAKLLGLSHDYVRKALRVLYAMGLVLPLRGNRSGFDQILLQTTPSDAVSKALGQLVSGELVPDLRAGVLQNRAGQAVQVPFLGERNFSDRRGIAGRGGHGGDGSPDEAVRGVFLVAAEDLAQTQYIEEVTSYVVSNRNSNVLRNRNSDVLRNNSNVLRNKSYTMHNKLKICETAQSGPVEPTARPDPSESVLLTRAELASLIDQAVKQAVTAKRRPKDDGGWSTLTSEQREQVEAIYADWRRVWKTSWSLTSERRKHISARLREGHTPAEFLEINEAFAREPFYWGDNERKKPYFDIFNLFGSTEKFERNLLRARRGLVGDSSRLQRPRDSQPAKGRRF